MCIVICIITYLQEVLSAVKFKAVLFDLDGTLLDTLQDIAISTNNALLRLGYPGHATETYKSFIGDGREELARRALPEKKRNPVMVNKLVALINEEYTAHWEDNTALYPGISDMLDTLTEKGIALTVLSNKAHEFTALMVSRLLAQWQFAIVRGALPDVAKKPDPLAAINIAEELGIPSSEFIYLGDSDIDMKTAIGAGMYPVGALWGFRSADELRSGGAKKLVKEPGDLLRLIKGK
jgi:phosphoglycolate phosphatase